ncbi:MAG: PHP domain-containing protein [Anaerolineae bacterium]
MEKRNLDPYGRLFKGNLHTHTTLSDGVASSDEAVQWYREHGYDFVALTDHWRAGGPYTGNSGGILVIPGVELHGTDPQLGTYHTVGLNICDCPPEGSLRTLAEATAYIAEEGGLAVLCHPYWCGMTSAAVERAEGVFALEVYNSTCELHIAKGLSAVHWDDVLARRRHLWGLAVDDTHWRGDEGGGWVMVQADEFSVESLLAALANGRFYATCGPDILDFYCENRRACARTSPARRIAFICDNWNGHLVRAGVGEDDITEAEFTVPDGVSYVRLEVDDRDHKRAWSNPIFLT